MPHPLAETNRINLRERRKPLRPDDVFFPAMAVLILAVVFIGFAQSYFLPGMVFAPLPNALVHLHGALFVSWIFLLVLQNGLVAISQVKWHMTLGILGVILPPLMVVFGVLTVFDSVRRNSALPVPFEMIVVGDFEELALFAGLTAWGLLARRSPVAHKRLMILGTIAIAGPAINRWPFPQEIRLPATMAVYSLLPLLVVAYDLWSRRRIHRSTAIATTLILTAMLTLVPVASLPIWHGFVAWIRRG
jgi:hypothetical protein